MMPLMFLPTSDYWFSHKHVRGLGQSTVWDLLYFVALITEWSGICPVIGEDFHAVFFSYDQWFKTECEIITLSGLELCFPNSGRIRITWWYFEENISSLSYWSMIKRRPLQRLLESSGWWLVARGTNFVIRVWNCQPSLPSPPGREPGVSVKLNGQWFNQSWLDNKASIKPLKDGVKRTS